MHNDTNVVKFETKLRNSVKGMQEFFVHFLQHFCKFEIISKYKVLKAHRMYSIQNICAFGFRQERHLAGVGRGEKQPSVIEGKQRLG